jgi:hypothetical protein
MPKSEAIWVNIIANCCKEQTDCAGPWIRAAAAASPRVHTGPERLSEAIVVRLAGRWGPDGNRLNARELYQSRRLNPPRPLYPLIIEAST